MCPDVGRQEIGTAGETMRIYTSPDNEVCVLLACDFVATARSCKSSMHYAAPIVQTTIPAAE